MIFWEISRYKTASIKFNIEVKQVLMEFNSKKNKKKKN